MWMITDYLLHKSEDKQLHSASEVLQIPISCPDNEQYPVKNFPRKSKHPTKISHNNFISN
jgi:hypothetical protein